MLRAESRCERKRAAIAAGRCGRCGRRRERAGLRNCDRCIRERAPRSGDVADFVNALREFLGLAPLFHDGRTAKARG